MKILVSSIELTKEDRGFVRFRAQTSAVGEIGVLVRDTAPFENVIRMLYSAYEAALLAKEAEAVKNRATPDPWIKRVYDLTTEYHVRTGKKVVIHDLLESFFATSIQTVDIEDRDAFMRRLEERLSLDAKVSEDAVG